MEFGFTWRRDYQEIADSDSGNSFRVYFSLRNLGFSRVNVGTREQTRYPRQLSYG